MPPRQASLFGTTKVASERSLTTDSPQRELHGALARLHLNTLYSDLTIASKTKSYAVHRAIVCTRSEFLAGWCRSGFDEVDTGVVSLHNDDPCVVDTMIQYFYRLDYDVPVEPAQEQESTNLLFHAKVYTLADKYLIQGLQDLAVIKFKTASTREIWNQQDFLNATKEAYDSTPDTSRAFREAVLKIFANHKELLIKEETREVLRETRMLAFDMLLYFQQKNFVF